MESLNSILLEQLECPVCNDYMHPPIAECSNGHNFCNKCVLQMKCCGLCRSSICSSRNGPLEQLHRQTIIPCTNRDDGCNRKELGPYMATHEGYCSFGNKQCLLSGCSWQGLFTEMAAHIGDHHAGSLHKVARSLLVFSGFNNSNGYQNRLCFSEVFDVYDNLFKVVVEVNCKEKVARFGVLVANGETGTFEYRIEMRNDYGEAFSCKRQCDVLSQNERSIFGYTHFLPMNYEMVRTCCIGDDLYFYLTISKV